MTTDRDELAILYRDIFESDRRGAAVLEDLVRRFGRTKVHTAGGIDAVLKTYQAAAHRELLDYIVMQINRANGVNDEPQPEGDHDV